MARAISGLSRLNQQAPAHGVVGHTELLIGWMHGDIQSILEEDIDAHGDKSLRQNPGVDP